MGLLVNLFTIAGGSALLTFSLVFIITLLILIVLYYSIQVKLSIYYFMIIQYKNILANTQL